MCMQDVDMFWDFISLRPETTHQVSFLFSDRGIPDGYRHMNGYGSHTFKMVSKDGQPVYCKFHYKVSTSTCMYTANACTVLVLLLYFYLRDITTCDGSVHVRSTSTYPCN